MLVDGELTIKTSRVREQHVETVFGAEDLFWVGLPGAVPQQHLVGIAIVLGLNNHKARNGGSTFTFWIRDVF